MLTAYAPGRPAHVAHRALTSACAAEDAARKCAVLWFGEILARRLYRDLGHASMQQYARRELGFSETRLGDFMRLARRLEQLPELRAALPEIGYTKAREIVRVASPRSEGKWVELARTSTREQLAQKVRRVKARSAGKVGKLFAGEEIAAAGPADEAPLAAEVPVRVAIEFTPEQHARWTALWERLRKRRVAGDRAEVLLAALHDAAATPSVESNNDETTPRGAAAPPVQVHVHECPSCGRVEAGGQPLGRTDAARVRCDAVVSRPGERNRATIPPRTRRAVLARDRHRCRAPGCGRRQFLEVHHRKPRHRGGGNEPENLITLCAGCHRLWHERRS